MKVPQVLKEISDQLVQKDLQVLKEIWVPQVLKVCKETMETLVLLVQRVQLVHKEI
jgi:hypothetical protein